MTRVRKNIVTLTVLLFVCAAVYLNWSYNNRWGQSNQAMVEAEDAAMAQAAENEFNTVGVSSYFATARLTRQTARDEALNLLEISAASESASQETIDAAMAAISTMAQTSLLETQIENMLIAKQYSDCVTYITDESITVTVPAPTEGLTAEAVAKITDMITSETDFTMDEITIIEIKQ
ncbi:MAG: SpoIIIAH-like family protein, partial [Oscillospiraceae bacterium]|nr:SpoIIIAH-like family protein [Oscillospiraceae bacterium]